MWNNSSKDSAVGEHPTQEVVPATPSIPPRIRPIIRTTRTDSASLPQDTLVTDSLLVDSLATDSLEAIFPAEKNVLQSAQEVPSGILGTLPLQLLRQQDGTFFVLIVCFLFIGLILRRGYSFLTKGITLLLSFRKQEELSNKLIVKDVWESIFLTLLPPLLVSLLMFQYFQLGDTELRSHSHTVATLIGFTLTGLFLLFGQHSVTTLLGYIFDGGEEIRLYQRIHIIGIEVFGLLTFAPIVAALYSIEYFYFVFWGGLCIYLIFKLVLFSHLISIFFRQKGSILTGFCYLCGVEVAPHILVFLGMQFAYKEGIFCIL